MKLDILAIGVHPDDVELSCAGTILKHIAKGYKVGVLDLTHGELGSRGTADTRLEEATAAAEILGLAARERLDLGDGKFDNTHKERVEIIKMIRKYQPDVVFCNAKSDRHPDHGRAAKLINDACFYSGLVKIETSYKGQLQDAWRPKSLHHYIQDYRLPADFVVDISDFINQKMAAILAYKTQFFNPDEEGPSTPISGEDFIEYIKAVSTVEGRKIGVRHGEGFQVVKAIKVDDVMAL